MLLDFWFENIYAVENALSWDKTEKGKIKIMRPVIAIWLICHGMMIPKKTIMRKKLTLKMGDASGAQNEKGSDVKNGCKKANKQ